MQILNPNLPEVLTKNELAEYLRVSSMSILRHEEGGDFVHCGRDKNNQRLYKKSDIEAYLQSIN